MSVQIDELTALLDWYVAAGVDVGLGDEPVDRFLESMREAEERQARGREIGRASCRERV